MSAPRMVASLCATKKLDGRKIHEITRKVAQEFKFAVKLRYFKQTHIFDLTPPIVGFVTQHTHVQLCYCFHKNYKSSSSVAGIYFEVRSTSGVENTNFSKTLLNGQACCFICM